MEGHDRVQQILDDHAALCAEFDHVGRLVKGAYDTPTDLAVTRESSALSTRYDNYTETLLRTGHPCAIATHDWDRIDHARTLIEARDIPGDYYFEVQQSIGDAQVSDPRQQGHPTQVYVVYGTQEWLYVCNRLAEDPRRLLQAVIDAVG